MLLCIVLTITKGYEVRARTMPGGVVGQTFSGSLGVFFVAGFKLLPIRASPGVLHHLPPTIFTV